MQLLGRGTGRHARRQAAGVEVDREDIAHQRHLPPGLVEAAQREHRNLRTETRQVPRRAAGFGQRDDALQLDVLGEEHRRHGDGFVGARQAAAGGFEIGVMAELALGAEADAGHGLDRLHRVEAAGRLGREHHRVGAVDDGVGDVEHFGAGRDRVVDHRLQHLRRRDDDAVARHRLADDLLLQAGQLGVADLHAEVAARDHDHFRGFDDLDEVLDRFRAFDLGDDLGVGTGGTRQFAGQLDVGGGTAERDGDEIDAELGGGGDVAAVLVGERAEAEAAAEAVQALAVRERAVGHHLGVDDVAGDLLDTQADQAVVEQQGVTRPDVARQAEVAAAHLRGIAGRRVGAADEGEGLAGLEQHFPLGELLDADLRTRQVGQHADLAAGAGGDGAHRGDALRVLLGGAVGEIQAHGVQAGGQQRVDDARRIGGRTQGGEDFGAAQRLAHGHAAWKGVPSNLSAFPDAQSCLRLHSPRRDADDASPWPAHYSSPSMRY